MALAKNLGGLKHFIGVLGAYEQALKNFKSAMEEICVKASDYAESRYSYYGHSSITVSYSNKGKRATIYAKGTAIAFFEFGTGEVGEGTYNGELPQSGVPITTKWDYYYLPSEHKGEKNNQLGWKWGRAFIRGIEAEAEMWDTAQFIKRESGKIMQDYFKKISGGV